ncbi:MAG: abortive phage resistance protein [Pedosphaera sp.]|nr:abortive phage resistance protein [Pedosphaera sp.]
MSTDSVVLNEILAQAKAKEDPSVSESEYFEFFSAKQILRDYSLDPEEIKSGIVGQESIGGSGSDGGIDSIYLLVNGKLIRDIEQAKELANLKQNIQFDMVIIQSKKEKGFGLTALNRLSNTSESIFQIDKQPKDFSEKYNEPLLDAIECFREAHRALITKQPVINVHFYYASLGDSSNVDVTIKAKALELEAKIPKILATIGTCQFAFEGARDMISLYRRQRKTQFSLKCLNSISDGKGGHVALVEIGDYYHLIVENGALREYLFESNVRDYEGDVDVNKHIRETLEKPHDTAGFWWLNNGITIVAESVYGHSQELAFDDPRIVNGLQTSQEIFRHFRQQPLLVNPDKRHAVIRIIQSPDDQLQDRIIKATNSQTKIPAQFLRASDDIQRDIEQVFKSRGLHYDRRKNSWRNIGRNVATIVGMTELAQSIAAVVLMEPDHARARPSRYFKDEHYNRVFSGIELNTYVTCALLRKRAEAFLLVAEKNKKDRNNLLFYILATMGKMIRSKALGKLVTLASVDVSGLPESVFSDALSIVRPIYERHGATDTAAKGTAMVADLKTALKANPFRKKKLKKTQ